ncbi:MAG: substrate-binding domain-containing protein [Desulfobulbaceae bacterium]
MKVLSGRKGLPVETVFLRRLFSLPLLAVLAVCCLLPLAGCDEPREVKKISLAEKVGPEGEPDGPTGKKLRIAVSAIISPRETFASYQDMLRYLEKKAGIPAELIQRETYQEVNELIGSRKLEMAFICTGAYVEGKERQDMELLAAPVVNGEPVYYSYIIVDGRSGIDGMEGLRGKSFAFTDPLSNTGCLAPRYLLLQQNETPEHYFRKTIFTNNHDRSIEAVAKGLVDGAAVDSLVYDALAESNPQLVAHLKIIDRSPPFGIPPVVVPRELPYGLKEQLREILLAMHQDPEGREILHTLKIDRFVRVEDALYDRVREMYRKVRAYDLQPR